MLNFFPRQLNGRRPCCFKNRSESISAKWLALTKPPSFTQTNQWVLQAEEQSRNRSLDRMSMKAASVYYLYIQSSLGSWVDKCLGSCLFYFHTTDWLIREDIQDVWLIMQHREKMDLHWEKYTVCWHVDFTLCCCIKQGQEAGCRPARFFHRQQLTQRHATLL